MACSTEFKHGTAANGLKYINFHIPHMKTKDTREDINITDSTCPCSATSTLEHHLSSNKAIPESTPLFTFKTANGQWAPMKHSWFMARCNAIWEKDGLTSVKGHGFQISSTTHLLLLGVDPWVVMVQGQWSFQAFLSYWRKWYFVPVHRFFFSVTWLYFIYYERLQKETHWLIQPILLPNIVMFLQWGVNRSDCSFSVRTVVGGIRPIILAHRICWVHIGTHVHPSDMPFCLVT